MNLETAVKKNIKGLLSSSDLMLDMLKNSQQEIVQVVDKIVKTDKEGGNCKELVNKQRTLIASSYLLDQDLSKALVQLSTVYKISKIANLDLGLSESDIQRLEYSLANEAFHFVEEKGEIVPRDKELYSKIEARIDNNETFTTEQFLEQLRKSPAYGKED